LVTLKIAGLVIALLFGFGFTPTYLDYTPLGQGLRRTVLEARANPSFVVIAVLVVASLIPTIMLGYALLASSQGLAVIVGYALAFVVAALGAVVLTPAPRRVAAGGPPSRGYVAQFMDEE
jgi:hypothetical protein